MPLRHQPPSLKKASMTVIANNFEQLCYDCPTQQQMMQLIDTEEYLEYEGPFTHMPSSVLEELMEVMSEIRSLHRKHLHMLLQSQIQNVNLSFGVGDTRNGLRFMMERSPGLLEEMMEEVKHVTYLRRHHLHVLLTPLTTTWNSHGIADQLVAFSLLTLRCKNLRKLNISYLRHMNPSILLNLVPTFSNLVSLNLRMTLTVDQVLAQIGKHCPNLMDLNLACTPISDRGLVQMCVAEDGRRTAQKLIRLIITETSVTKAGAAVVLQSLPLLREFDYDHIFDALEMVEMWDEGIEQRLTKSAGVRLNAELAVPPTRIKLTTLVSTADYIDPKGLDAATRLCPDATTVSISNAWLQNESLYKFMVLEHLESLSITNSEGLTLDFYEGILPLLSVCGHKLQNLILANFASVDVTTIGKLCPELQNLALSNIAQYDPVGKPSPSLFKNLQALELWSDPQADLSPYLIKQFLLFCPDMRNLLFKGCEILTDELLLEVWQVNPMVKLSHLTLDHCHHISRDTLQYLLDVENELTVVRIWSCVKIKKRHYTELITYIREENMDIYFEWFEYDE